MTRPANAKVPTVSSLSAMGKPSGWPGGDIAASWCIAQMQGQMHVHSLGAQILDRHAERRKQIELLPVSHGTEV
jgi:hypothetical protein